MDKSISELLNDEPGTDEPPITVETLEGPTEGLTGDGEPPRLRDEHGRFAAKGEDEGAPPAPVTEEPKLDHAAIVAERRRRQEAENERNALKAELESLRNPPQPPPSIWEDEDAARQHDRHQSVAEAVQQATFNARLDMSEMMVRQANPDFEEVKAQFLELAEQNPTLRQQALADPHPWNKAYQIAKTHRTMAELGATDIDTLKARLREELKAEMQAEPPAARPGLPPTLTNERNVGSRSGPAWTGPPSLSELLR